MLRNTFLHLDRVGERGERRLWKRGIREWDAYLERYGKSGNDRLSKNCMMLEKCGEALAEKKGGLFASLLPNSHHFRAYPEFKEKCAYVDIETTGLGEQSVMTVIGVYDPAEKRSVQYVRGKNLGKFADDLKKYSMLVTFSGSVFDLPFIRREMGISFDGFLHADLRFALAKIGLRGGLKSIEKQLGVERGGETAGLTGWDAVKLWNRYERRGDEGALDLLLKYNIEDIANMEVLMEHLLRERKKELEAAQ